MELPRNSTGGISPDNLRKEQIDTLRDLVQIDDDGIHGFRKASEHVHDSGINSALHQCAAEREKFQAELKRQILALGGDPDKGEHVAAKVHRWWMDVRKAMNSDEGKAILSEVIRGEEVAVDAYAKALRKPLTGETQQLVQRQYEGVTQAREKVRRLHDNLRP